MTLKTTALENLVGDKRLDVNKIVDGATKMFVNYNGNTASIAESRNVSSAVDVATGTYAFNLTNAMAGNHYSIGTSLQLTDQPYNTYYGMGAEIDRFTDPTPASVQVISIYFQNGVRYDCGLYSVTLNGDLAE